MNSALETISLADDPKVRRALENKEPGPVREALCRTRKGPSDLALLLSPGSDDLIELIAQTAHKLTLERFGRTVQLYGPLYVSNHCVGRCPYCGFRNDLDIRRCALNADDVVSESLLMFKTGLKHILLVCGDDRKRAGASFLAEAVRRLKDISPCVCIEVPPLDEEDYRALVEAGADGVTLYQETYDRSVYSALHERGPKSDYDYRLEALGRAGAAGMHKLTPGALLGLAQWRLEGVRLGLHAKYLEKKYWKSSVSIGLPRLRNTPSDFEIPCPLDDRAFAHVIAALRVFLPDAGLILSTREPPELRERLLSLGITQMSAGSRTEPGGYSKPQSSGSQFRVSDERSPREVADALLKLGYNPVFKDWDRALGRF